LGIKAAHKKRNSIAEGGRGSFSYETCFETDNYHVVSGKNGIASTQFTIEPNIGNVFSKGFTIKRAPAIAGFAKRMPINAEN